MGVLSRVILTLAGNDIIIISVAGIQFFNCIPSHRLTVPKHFL